MSTEVHVLKIKEMKSVDRGTGLKAWPLVREEIGSDNTRIGFILTFRITGQMIFAHAKG